MSCDATPEMSVVDLGSGEPAAAVHVEALDVEAVEEEEEVVAVASPSMRSEDYQGSEEIEEEEQAAMPEEAIELIM